MSTEGHSGPAPPQSSAGHGPTSRHGYSARGPSGVSPAPLCCRRTTEQAFPWFPSTDSPCALPGAPAPRGWPLRPAHRAPANQQRFATLCPQRIEHGPAGPAFPPQSLASMHWRFLLYALWVYLGRFPEGFRFHRGPSRTLLLPPGHFRLLKPRDQ